MTGLLTTAPTTDEPGDFQSKCGRVRAMAPTGGKPYWRLEYTDLGGHRHQPSGGRSRETALRKMNSVLARLDGALEHDKTAESGSAILDKWLEPARKRKGGRAWSGGTRQGHLGYVKKYLRPVLGKHPAHAWGIAHFRAAVNAAPTRKEGEQVHRRLRAFLNWGHIHGYVTDAQLLAFRRVAWEPPSDYQERPERAVRARESGEDESYLPLESAMDESELAAICDALESEWHLGRLFGETGAATGMRQGELFGLGADEVRPEESRVRVRWQWNCKVGELTLPKFEKRRTTIWEDGPTITGFDLGPALAARKAAALREREEGRNPNALMFPSPRGTYWSASNFDSRVWIPAMARARVDFVEYTAQCRHKKHCPGGTHQHRLYKYTTHSLRDRFAISALNVWGWELDGLQVTGGWKDSEVIFKRYYGVARRVLDRLQAKSKRGAA